MTPEPVQKIIDDMRAEGQLDGDPRTDEQLSAHVLGVTMDMAQHALDFASQPESFPVFRAWLVALAVAAGTPEALSFAEWAEHDLSRDGVAGAGTELRLRRASGELP